MARIRNRNPFDVSGWTGEIEIVEMPTITWPGAASLLVLSQDAGRLWILATSTGGGTEWALWPKTQTGLFGIMPGADYKHVLIHNASYPSLVQGNWYLRTIAGPGTVELLVGRATYDRGQ